MPETFTQSLSENLLTIMAHSDQYGRLVANMVKSHHFENDVHRTLATRIIDYWQKQKRAPGKLHTPDLVADILEDRNNRRATMYRAVLTNMIVSIDTGINATFVLDQLRTHLRLHAFKKAVLESADRLQSGTPASIEDTEVIWGNLLRSRQVEFEPGMRLSNFQQVVEHIHTQAIEFGTGIAPLDEAGIVPMRGKVMVFLAPTGYGKTWFAVNCGKRAFLDRKKVLHITLGDLDESEVLGRYFQALFAVPKHEATAIRTSRIRRNQLERFGGIETNTIVPAFRLDSPDVLAELEAHLGWFGARLDNLLVKRFPSRTLTAAKLDAYLDQLDLVENFRPDLTVLDYLGVLQTDPKNHTITLAREFEEFRAVLERRNMAGVAPHQINRKGSEAKVALATHSADAFAIIQAADIAIVMNATRAERSHNLARLWVSKARSERDQFGVLVTQSYATGQFSIDAIRLDAAYETYLAALERPEEDDEEEETEEA